MALAVVSLVPLGLLENTFLLTSSNPLCSCQYMFGCVHLNSGMYNRGELHPAREG